MSPGSLPDQGTDENPHSNRPTTTIATPAKTRLFPIGAIAELPLHRLYKTRRALSNTRADLRLIYGCYACAWACDLAPAASRAACVSLIIFSAIGAGASS